jgi:hypothetical protein
MQFPKDCIIFFCLFKSKRLIQKQKAYSKAKGLFKSKRLIQKDEDQTVVGIGACGFDRVVVSTQTYLS